MKKIESISFGGAGLNYVYYAGVLQKLIKEDLFSSNLIAHGSSAGSFVALAILNHIDGVESLADALATSAKYFDDITMFNKFPFKTNLTEILHEIISKWISLDSESYKRLNGRLHISISNPLHGGRIINQFSSNKEVLSAIYSSCYIPFVLDVPEFRWENSKLNFDGCFTKNTIKFDDSTLVVGLPLFDKNEKFDISPSKNLGILSCVYTPFSKQYAATYGLGYHDAEKWLEKIK
jgi:predicted acylesterase/phospholipase RssA